MSQFSQSLQLNLQFIDGTPDGTQIARINHWTGYVIRVPRTSLTEALSQPKAKHRGVYLLFGADEHGAPWLYVGESNNMADRLRNQANEKNWWTSAVMITTEGNDLNKGEIEYLEARLLEIARSVNRIGLVNRNQPDGDSLSEKDKNSMNIFLEKLMIVLPTMRIDCFLDRKKPTIRMTPNQDRPAVFELFNKKHNIKATMIIQDKQYVVQEGSQARDKWYGGQHHTYTALHQNLMEDGVLRKEETHAIFTCDYAFKKSSAAGAVITGRSTNGRVEWKERSTGKTLGDWEKENLSE